MLYHSYEDARADADAEDKLVLGAIRADGTPIYMIVDREADETECRDFAFEAINDRPLSGYEQTMIKLGLRVKD